MERVNILAKPTGRVPKKIQLHLTVEVSLDNLVSLVFDAIWLTSEGREEWERIVTELTEERILEMMSEKVILEPHYGDLEDDYKHCLDTVRKRIRALYRGTNESKSKERKALD